jgi:hypothetical protein
MKKSFIIGLMMVVATVLVTGCRSTEKVTATSSTEREYLTMNFSGQADGIGFNGQLRVAKDSIIWCNFSKIIDLGRAMATPDSVWVDIPLLNRHDAGTYAMVKRLTGTSVTFDELQAIVLSDNAEERIHLLAQRMGHDVTVRIKKREHVDKLTFPFNK